MATSYNENLGVKLSALKLLAQRTDARLDALEGAGYQTEQNVTDAINARISSTYKAGGSVAFASLPTADAAHEGYVYNVTDAFTTTASFVEGANKKHPAGTNVAVVRTSAADAETATFAYDVLAGFVDLSGYQEKVSGATANHVATLDANGQVQDGGHALTEYLTEHQDISGKADKVSGATAENFAALNAQGNLTDSGKKASDFVEKVLVDGVEDAVVHQSDFATDADVTAMLDEVYGAATTGA